MLRDVSIIEFIKYNKKCRKWILKMMTSYCNIHNIFYCIFSFLKVIKYFMIKKTCLGSQSIVFLKLNALNVTMEYIWVTTAQAERSRFIVRNHGSDVGILSKAPESKIRIDWIIYTHAALTPVPKGKYGNGCREI